MFGIFFLFHFTFTIQFVHKIYSKESGHELLALNAQDSDDEDDHADYEGMEAAAKERDGTMQGEGEEDMPAP